MRESIARRAALGTGLLVVGAVTLFAAVQQQEVAGMGTVVATRAESSSALNRAPEPVRDTPAPDLPTPADRPAAADAAARLNIPVPSPVPGIPASSPAGAPRAAAPEPEPSPAPMPAAAAAARVPPPPSGDLLALGERVYDEQRCAACHSIAGVGSPRSPLDGVGSRLSAAEIRLWIVDPQSMRPGIRKPSFDELPAAEIEALVAFIQQLR